MGWRAGHRSAALLAADTPRSVSGSPQTPGSRTGFYGFGTNVGDDYSGRVRLGHSGGFAQGAATYYNLLPDQQLGIMVLTNGMPIGFPEATAAYFMDLVIGGAIENDWFSLYEQVINQMYINPIPLKHWDGNLFAFLPVGENAVGVSAATFAPGSGSNRAGSLTLEYYDETGLGVFTR